MPQINGEEVKGLIEKYRDRIKECKAAIEKNENRIKETFNNLELPINVRENTLNVYKNENLNYKQQMEDAKKVLGQIREDIFLTDKDAKTAYLYERGQALAEDIENLKNKKIDIDQIKMMAKDKAMEKAIKDVYRKLDLYQMNKETYKPETIKMMSDEIREALENLKNTYTNFNGLKQQEPNEFITTVMEAKPDTIVDWNNTSLEEIFDAETKKIDEKISRRNAKIQQVYNDGIENGVRFSEFESIVSTTKQPSINREEHQQGDSVQTIPPKPLLPTEKDEKPFWPWGNARKQWNARHNIKPFWPWGKARKEWEDRQAEAEKAEAEKAAKEKAEAEAEKAAKEKAEAEKAAKEKEWNEKVSKAKEYGKRNHGYNSFREDLRIDINSYLDELKRGDRADDRHVRQQNHDDGPSL